MTAADNLKTIRGRVEHSLNSSFTTQADMDRARLLDALERVLAIHYPTDVGTDTQWCAECYVNDDPAEVEWPCPTVTAINDALEGK